MTTTSVAPTVPEVPPQATNSFRFSLFNAVNFQITLGAPMVLYAKALGGSATTIGIVASLASGLVANFGTMTKSLRAGRTAQSGVIAARLAGQGFTASLDVLEHQTGFLRAHSPSGTPDIENGTIDIGKNWRLAELGIKVAVHRELPKVQQAYQGYLRQRREAHRRGMVKPTAEQQSVEKLFPAIAQWVRDGHIEIGDQEGFGFVVRALDYGGMVFEDDKPDTLTEAMASLEKGLAD